MGASAINITCVARHGLVGLGVKRPSSSSIAVLCQNVLTAMKENYFSLGAFGQQDWKKGTLPQRFLSATVMYLESYHPYDDMSES